MSNNHQPELLLRDMEIIIITRIFDKDEHLVIDLFKMSSNLTPMNPMRKFDEERWFLIKIIDNR